MKTIKNFTLTVLFLFVTTLALSSFVSAQDAKKDAKPAQIKTSALEIKRVDPGDVKISPAFLVALYEHLIAEVTKTGKITKIMRDGDRGAATTKDIVRLQCTVTQFKEGSQRQREVTTVAGATSLHVIAKFVDASGKVLLEKDVSGSVHFFGDNLKATYDLSKHVATLVKENF